MSVTLETCDKLRLDAAYTTAKSPNECRSCRLTRGEDFCNSLHIKDLPIVGRADSDNSYKTRFNSYIICDHNNRPELFLDITRLRLII
jgi:hypothetical protein